MIYLALISHSLGKNVRPKVVNLIAQGHLVIYCHYKLKFHTFGLVIDKSVIISS